MCIVIAVINGIEISHNYLVRKCCAGPFLFATACIGWCT